MIIPSGPPLARESSTSIDSNRHRLSLTLRGRPSRALPLSQVFPSIDAEKRNHNAPTRSKERVEPSLVGTDLGLFTGPSSCQPIGRVLLSLVIRRAAQATVTCAPGGEQP